MLRSLALLLFCTATSSVFAEASARNKLYQAAYCLGAIREKHHLAATDCEGQWINRDFASLAECKEYDQFDEETLGERHQRFTNYIWLHLPKMNPSVATQAETLTKLGEDHVKSRQIGSLEFYDRCMRDCLSWPPTEGCVSAAR